MTTVAMLTALPKEHDAIVKRRGRWVSQPLGSSSTFLQHDTTTIGDLQLHAVCAVGMGQTDAAIAASELLDATSRTSLYLWESAPGSLRR